MSTVAGRNDRTSWFYWLSQPWSNPSCRRYLRS